MDDGVGVVLDTLDKRDLLDNTVIIFAGDNGKNGKLTCYDGSGKVPMVIRWPGVTKAGIVSDKLVSNIDMPSTILDVCRIKKPQDMAF